MDMTTKERWLAAIKMQPVDRLPFWPKIDEAYPRAQNPPHNSMEINKIHNWIGSDNHIWIRDERPHFLSPAFTKEVRNRTSIVMIVKGNTRKMVFSTNYGSTELIEKFDVGSQSWHPIRYPAQNVEDIRILIEVFKDCRIEGNQERIYWSERFVKEIGSSAVTATWIGMSPLMSWLEYYGGIENGHYLLVDHQDDVEELFEVMHNIWLRKTEILADKVSCDLLYFVEDTSTTIISRKQFQKYCYNHLLDYAQIINEAGKPFVLHMCGHLKSLLFDLNDLPVAAFEAFSTPPVGNTTLLDGRIACPDKCLIGGTNAALWLQTPNQIIADIEMQLDELPHHRGIVISSAGVMPPGCNPNTIRDISDWIKSYPSKT